MVRTDLDPDNSDRISDEEMGVAVPKRKFRRNKSGPAPDGTNSDLHVADNLMTEPRQPRRARRPPATHAATNVITC